MTRDDIAAKVQKVLVEEFELAAADLVDGARLREDLGLDSLDAVDLVVSLEQVFGGHVAEGEARKVRTVGDVYALVESTIAAHAARHASAG
jgi:acyl carrier protein